MSGRNPGYNVKHTTHPSRKPATHPSQRTYPVLEQPGPLTYQARLDHYTAGTGNASRPLTPAQRKRLDAKAHRYGTRDQRIQAAADRRAAAIAAAQQARDQHLLGRVVQLPVARWATSAKAALRSGHRG